MAKFDKSALLSLSADTSRQGRRALVDAISDLFMSDDAALEPSERSLIYEILTMTIHDVEMDVRRNIAEHIAERMDVPAGLIGLLIDDKIEIAYPILAYSTLLADEDLIDVIQSKTRPYHQAVTQRDNLSEIVSDELVETGDVTVISRLLANASAKISHGSFEKIVDWSHHDEALQELLLRRQDIPVALVEQLFKWVKVILRQYILDNFDVDRKALDEILIDIVFDDVHKIKNEAINDRHMHPSGNLVSDLGLREPNVVVDHLLRALSEKRILDFLTIFERKFDLPQPILLRAISDKGTEGLAVAVKSARLGKAVFLGILGYLRLCKINGDIELRDEIRRSMNFYDSIDDGTVSDIVARWKSNEDFVFAMGKLNPI